jgi:hypothetical protein
MMRALLGTADQGMKQVWTTANAGSVQRERGCQPLAGWHCWLRGLLAGLPSPEFKENAETAFDSLTPVATRL